MGRIIGEFDSKGKYKTKSALQELISKLNIPKESEVSINSSMTDGCVMTWEMGDSSFTLRGTVDLVLDMFNPTDDTVDNVVDNIESWISLCNSVISTEIAKLSEADDSTKQTATPVSGNDVLIALCRDDIGVTAQDLAESPTKKNSVTWTGLCAEYVFTYSMATYYLDEYYKDSSLCIHLVSSKSRNDFVSKCESLLNRRTIVENWVRVIQSTYGVSLTRIFDSASKGDYTFEYRGSEVESSNKLLRVYSSAASEEYVYLMTISDSGKVSPYPFSTGYSSTTDINKIIKIVDDWALDGKSEPIITDSISQESILTKDDSYTTFNDDILELIALKADNKIVGYRFKTSNTCMDITSEKAKELGIYGMKVKHQITLELHNGVWLSSSEFKRKKIYEDVSEDTALCNSLVQRLFS